METVGAGINTVMALGRHALVAFELAGELCVPSLLAGSRIHRTVGERWDRNGGVEYRGCQK